MRVRIKIKHLALTLLAACLLLLAMFAAYPRVQDYLAQRAVLNGKAMDKESLLRLLSQGAPGDRKWPLIRAAVIEQGRDSWIPRYDVYIGPDSSQTIGGGEDDNIPSLSEAEKRPYLEAYVRQGPVDGYLVRAAKQLAVSYYGEGQLERALTVLESAEGRLDEEASVSQRRKELQLERARLYAADRQAQQAANVLDELAGSLSAQDGFINGEVEKLRKQLERETKPVREGLATVAGTVKRSDGKPLAHVGVYLRDQASASSSVSEGEPYQTATDAQGRFRIGGVNPGSYQLQLGLMFEQIDGWTWPVPAHDWVDIAGGESITKEVVLHPLLELIEPVNQQVVNGETVRFAWTPVPGAATYTVNGKVHLENGTLGSAIATRVRAASLDVPVERLYDHLFGISYGMADEGEQPKADPLPLLGFANPDNRFSWSVEAFDAAGRPLTRSDGYRLQESTMGKLPFFYLKQRSLTAADRLLLQGKFSEAMEGYRRDCELNDRDLHCLRMLIRLHQVDGADNQERSGKEVLPYLRKMVELNPAPHYVFLMLEHSMEQRSWAEADRYYGMLADRDGLNPYTSSVYAVGLLRQGKLPEASELLRSALEQDESHRFTGIYLAVRLYLTGSLQEPLKLAGQYPERTFGQERLVWAELLRAMEEEGKANPGPDYMEKLKQELALYFAGEEAQLDARPQAAEHPARDHFLRELRKVK
ncbi:Carboxypeptidase regulatory-like domain-containing protein [Paenibacillus sp. UNCCL117]|uniref:carboxypeptidase-like regulatory domain-containing protein n=1 Tax=unclassified Paenibacillus TaxID=185978 RepID=UPI0008905A51|nr:MULTISPECIES: carboxypeptidase-like regulatory domain-containing protein [unclassified Paenibacillus]SDD12586.1 Carboxypeptidase regulatory-like domain-containing protein [Paenibacillus sp. cl123]SFW33819.1 Carboxypeptidase regulatory-like domain-containing protein [Paenibacillus sp. UNCCL117]